MVPPGRRSPSLSAASIIATAIRSLTEPPGFMCSILATRLPLRVDPRQPDQGRVAYGGEDVGMDLHGRGEGIAPDSGHPKDF